VGSTEPVHAELSRAWLADRAARFQPVAELLALAPGAERAEAATAAVLIGLRESCARAAAAGREWAATDPRQRALLLERWAFELEQQRGDLARLLAGEIAKPVAEAQDELRRSLAHIRSAARLARGHLEETPVSGVRVRYRALGTVALVTPWNNPLAIAAGKLAPALACGNGCLWKPSPLAPECSARLLQSLRAAGLPPGLVEPVAGGAEVVSALIADARVDAVSVTGSNTAGQAIAARCAARQIPLQAELGGNNAALILDDWTFDEAALQALARSVFGFAGQRCTALRRLIVQRGILERFGEAFARAVRALPVGDPLDPATAVGPLLSRAHRERVQARLDGALADGALVLARARLPDAAKNGPDADRWLAPTLLGNVRPESDIAQHETFGPLALILPADDLDEAIALANGVPQGLLAALYGNDEAARHRVAEQVQAGILKLAPGPLLISAEAPFCGWKASAIGPPEHGIRDRDFYARPQTLYL
jgi:acyl-CoA reductase-like NAD-dependent aldehyde dehydrogenase